MQDIWETWFTLEKCKNQMDELALMQDIWETWFIFEKCKTK